MLEAASRITRALGLVALVALVAGCGSTIRVPLAVEGNPGTGPALAIRAVEDARRFRDSFDSSSPWTPSFRRPADASNPSRVVGMLRNTFGRPLRNVYLSEDQTVESLMRDAVTSGFRRAGYRVLREGDPGYADAIPLTAEVERFWVWMRPGFAAISLEFESHVRLHGGVDPFRDGHTTCGYIELHSQGAGKRQLRNTIMRGLDDFVENLASRARVAGSDPANRRTSSVDARCLEAKEQLP